MKKLLDYLEQKWIIRRCRRGVHLFEVYVNSNGKKYVKRCMNNECKIFHHRVNGEWKEVRHFPPPIDAPNEHLKLIYDETSYKIARLTSKNPGVPA